MDPYTLYQVLYGGAAAAGVGGLGAAGYGTYRAAKGLYNMLPKRARKNAMGSMSSRYMLSKCRRTRSRNASAVRQKTITAPQSRVIDTKYVDRVTTYSGLKLSTPIEAGLNDIAGGSGEGQRVGNDIRLVKILVTWQIKHGSDNLDQTYRLIIVRYKTGNTATGPGIASLLNTDASSSYSPNSFRNVPNLEDFEILLDKKVLLVQQQVAVSHAVRTFQYSIDVCIPQRFSGSGSNTIIRNPLFAYIVTNATNTTTGASGELSFRTMYSDI